MDADRWVRLAALFAGAMELDEGERRRYLEREAPDDPELRRQVARLLHADREADGFLEPGTEPAPGWLPGEPPPDGRIGAYRLHHVLGRGGMGTVFLASRDDGSGGPVALKLLPASTDHPAALARFRREGRILARLRHPGIARLLEAGATGDGRPFLVLEHVDGEPLDEHCRRRGLPTDERIRLLLRLCDAVEHAHGHGLVHRDLKPSNVLVTCEGAVKLLDFGIAKPLSAHGDSTTLETASGHHPLTPLYASPEQLRGLPVGPASDVYSLGVLCYRVLTGTLPHRPGDGAPGALERAICEEEPRPPSAAAERGEGPAYAVPRRELAGDLDRIVLKALRKEPARRYASVAELAADLERHLERRPVHRHLDHLVYRLQRSVRRHRTRLALLLLVLGTATGAATLAERQSEEMAAERQRSALAVEEMVDLLAAPPKAKDGSEDHARRAMIRGFQNLACRLQGRPREEIEMLDTVADLAREAGMPDIAWGLLTKGVELRRRHLPDDRRGLAATLQRLGEAYLELADGPAARDPLREALALRREIGADDPALAATLQALGRAEHASWRLEAAAEHLREALVRTAPNDGAARVLRLCALAAVLRDRGDAAAAEAGYVEARREAAGRLDPGHSALAAILVGEAESRRAAGDLAGAETAYRQALDLLEAAAPDDGPEVLALLRDLAQVLELRGRGTEAEELLQDGLHRARERTSAGFEVARFLGELGRLEAARGDLVAATALQEESVELLEAWLGPDHWEVGRARFHLARLDTRRGRVDEARAELARSAKILTGALAPDHPLRDTLHAALEESREARDHATG